MQGLDKELLYRTYVILSLIVKSSPAVCYYENKARYDAKNNEYYVSPAPGATAVAKCV